MTTESAAPRFQRRLPIGLIVLLTATAAMLPLSAQGKTARCVIKQEAVTAYSGVCDFQPGTNGSFNIRGSGGQAILPSITTISVFIESPGVAEVRGLTTQGVNSRWGSAVRSKLDPACWKGSDFEICAY